MNTDTTVRLGVLLSGRGSNFKAIVNAINICQIPSAKIVAVLSNVEKAPGMDFAKEKRLPTRTFFAPDFDTRQDFDAAMAKFLTEQQVDWILLAGYNRILSVPFIQAFEDRILNIHPSLLPKFGGKGMVGLAVHQAVLDAGETESGCTVHSVTETVDDGPILGQRKVAVLPDDTAETLADRVLKEEHKLYPGIVEKLADYTVTAKQAGQAFSISDFLTKVPLTRV